MLGDKSTVLGSGERHKYKMTEISGNDVDGKSLISEENTN
jgi:hypothetical protein